MIKAIVDFNTVFEFAKFRDSTHSKHASRRPLSDDFEYVGLAGEVAFAQAYNAPMDLRSVATGDKGVDFYTIAGTVDVKTARKPFNLIVEEGKVVADIYVLARYHDQTKKAELLGWEYGQNIKKWSIKDFGYGIRNHYKSASQLRKMSELSLLLKGGSNG
jgi:hypothetical protein